jgi:allantoinase
LIDPHVHFREPGLAYKEDWESGSQAAVMGGVTTVLDMPNTVPPTDTAARFAAKLALIQGRAYCDYGLFGLLGQANLAELGPLTEQGAIGFKCFLGRSTGDILPPDDGTLLAALARVAELDRRCAVHAENDAILEYTTRELRQAGRTDPLAHVLARPIVAEEESIQRVGLFAARTGARVHILHLSSTAGLAAIERWRAQGVDLTCEVTPHHCFLSADDMVRLGSIVKINPPVRLSGHGAALLAAAAAGRVDAIATDHAPHTAEEKLRTPIWDAVSGFAGVELSLRLFLTYAVHPGRLTLEQLVELMAAGPARVWGLPRKGAIRVGADGDLTIVDLDRTDTIAAARLHGKNNLTPWEGRATRGAVVATILRGRPVVVDGQLRGEPRGELVTPRH